jgi:hypothetical protein
MPNLPLGIVRAETPASRYDRPSWLMAWHLSVAKIAHGDTERTRKRRRFSVSRFSLSP